MIVDSTPTVPIRLKLSPELARRAAQGMQAVAVPAVTRVVAELLSKLAIPGQPEVSCEPNDEEPTARRPLAIYANGRLCRYSDELMLLLYSYVQGKVALSLDALNGLQSWLTSAEEHLVAEWLSLLCQKTLGRDARVLLGAEQARAYCAALALPTGGAAPDHAHLGPILARALDLGIGIADHAAVAAALGDGTGTDDVLGEALIAALRPDRVEIRIEQAYLRQLSIDDGAHGPELFAFLRDGLFTELGVAYPRFHIVSDETLRPGSFAVTVNNLAGVPLIGLPPDRILVNDVPERLRLYEVATEPALNPATGQPCALAPRGAKERFEAAGLTTWDQFKFLILCLAGELRTKSARLVDRQLTTRLLKQLGRAFPELEQATDMHLSLDQLTAVLRGLVAEQISIRNLRRILELSLEHELFVHTGTPLAERLSYVRAGLCDVIAHKYKKPGDTVLVVYLLDPAVEQAVAASGDPPDADLAQQLINAIRAELVHLPAAVSRPPILVGEAACKPLQTMIADELPRMRVLSYPQLPPDLNLQPLARISLKRGGH